MKRRLHHRKTSTRSVVLIATPTEGVHWQWAQALEGMCTVVAVAERGALDQILVDLKPDILLLDLALPRLGGIKGVVAIRTLSPETKIVLFARSPNAEEGISLLRAGAWGYCERDIEPLLLKKVVSRVRKGEVWLKRSLVPHLIGELARLTRHRLKDSLPNHDNRIATLTPREREVVSLVGDCSSNKEIASRLTVSEHTVKAHLTAIFRKLDLSGRVQLALLANQSGLGSTSPSGSYDLPAGVPPLYPTEARLTFDRHGHV